MKQVFSWVNRRAGINNISWNLFLDCVVNSNEHYLTNDDRAEIAESGTPHLTTLKKLDDWYVKKVKSSIDPCIWHLVCSSLGPLYSDCFHVDFLFC